MQAFPRLLLFANLVFKLSSLVHAVLVNVTIDDASPDPLTGFSIVYQPPTVWKKGPSCQDCNANLDPTQTTDGTWHESLVRGDPFAVFFLPAPSCSQVGLTKHTQLL